MTAQTGAWRTGTRGRDALRAAGTKGEVGSGGHRPSVTTRVVLLGTGDPLNDERAQASLAIEVGGGALLLLDTSSGTILLHLLRLAGLDPARIRHIVISHRHFDHAGGLAPLLVALSGRPEATLTVHAPLATLAALHALLATTIPGVEEWLGARLCWSPLTPDRPVLMGDAVVTPFAVAHGLECVGVCVERAGARIVYSADTRPCAALSAYAARADLLIHEAYGPDTTAAEAHRFGHATAADAARVGRDADVRHLVLTHLRNSRVAAPDALRADAAAIFAGLLTLATDLIALDVAAAPPVA